MNVNEISSSGMQNIPTKPASVAQPEQWQKELEKAGVSKTEQTRQTTPSETLTRDEQSYFEDLFPSSAPELQAYSMYRQDGSRSDSALGTVVDRRG